MGDRAVTAGLRSGSLASDWARRHEERVIADCHTARTVLAAWFVLVDAIGTELQEGRDAALRDDWPAAQHALRAMAASLGGARSALTAAEESRDRSVGRFAADLNSEFARLTFFASRFDANADPGPAFEDELRLLLAATAFDDGAFGRWLRESCPGLADEALQSIASLREGPHVP